MVIFVGMNPSRVSQKRRNSTLNTLASWVETLGLSQFEFVNVSNDDGDLVRREHVEHETLEQRCSKHGSVIALGSIPSMILRKKRIEHFKLPHPSPKNRVLNDKILLNCVLESCGKYIEENN